MERQSESVLVQLKLGWVGTVSRSKHDLTKTSSPPPRSLSRSCNHFLFSLSLYSIGPWKKRSYQLSREVFLTYKRWYYLSRLSAVSQLACLSLGPFQLWSSTSPLSFRFGWLFKRKGENWHSFRKWKKRHHTASLAHKKKRIAVWEDHKYYIWLTRHGLRLSFGRNTLNYICAFFYLNAFTLLIPLFFKLDIVHRKWKEKIV